MKNQAIPHLFYATLLVCCLLCGIVIAHPLSAQTVFLPTDVDLLPAAVPASQTIVGGQDADPGEWPWQAVVKVGPRFCGGSLIAEQWVLTASHCLYRNQELYAPTALQITLGEHRIDKTEGHEQTYTVDQIVAHPDYEAATFNNDIALLHLAAPAMFDSYVTPIALLASPDDDALISADTMVTVTGWGVTEVNVGLSPVLQEVGLPVVTNELCNESYGLITDNMLCAGYAAGGKDSCQGDSGGPLVATDNQEGWKLAGIVSFGAGCAEPQYYGVYTRVSRYIEWIQTTITQPTPTPQTTPQPTTQPAVTPMASPTPLLVGTPLPRPTDESTPPINETNGYLPLIYH